MIAADSSVLVDLISGQEQAGTDDPAWKTEDGYLRLHNDLGVMPYYYYPEFMAAYPVYDATVTVRNEQKGHASATIWETPAGSIRMEGEFVAASCSHAWTRYAVQTEADLDVFEQCMGGPGNPMPPACPL